MLSSRLSGSEGVTKARESAAFAVFQARLNGGEIVPEARTRAKASVRCFRGVSGTAEERWRSQGPRHICVCIYSDSAFKSALAYTPAKLPLSGREALSPKNGVAALTDRESAGMAFKGDQKPIEYRFRRSGLRDFDEVLVLRAWSKGSVITVSCRWSCFDISNEGSRQVLLVERVEGACCDTRTAVMRRDTGGGERTRRAEGPSSVFERTESGI